jgi:hypothetical protein
MVNVSARQQFAAGAREQCEDSRCGRYGRVGGNGLLDDLLLRFLVLKEPLRGAVAFLFVVHGDQMRCRGDSAMNPPVALFLGEFQEAAGRRIGIGGNGRAAHKRNREQDFPCSQKATCGKP